jgi:hypothetical protein
MESRSGIVLCDGDPMKLHYDYCLARVGHASPTRFATGVAAARRAMGEELLGIADLVLCWIPDDATLRAHPDDDRSRTRRTFDLHRLLGAPLGEWYAALDALDPGRVRWSFPTSLDAVVPRARYDLALFDAWMGALPLGDTH